MNKTNEKQKHTPGPNPRLQRVVYHDKGTDTMGRREFTLYWEDLGGPFRQEEHPDGKVVGYRRAQVFHARPEEILRVWRKNQ